jgi:chromatin remodeling complex protein RSC6
LEDGLSAHLTFIANPPKFEVDPLLERIVGMKTGTRVEVLDAFWLYVKSKKLQDMENKEIINSDEFIRQVYRNLYRLSKRKNLRLPPSITASDSY